MYLVLGVSALGGAPGPGGCLLWGVSAQGVHLVLGVSALGGVCSGGVPGPGGGVCSGGCT